MLNYCIRKCLQVERVNFNKTKNKLIKEKTDIIALK